MQILILGLGNPVAERLARMLATNAAISEIVAITRTPQIYSNEFPTRLSLRDFGTMKPGCLTDIFDFVFSFLPLDKLSNRILSCIRSNHVVVISSASRYVKKDSPIVSDIKLVDYLTSNENRIRSFLGHRKVIFVYPTIIIGPGSKFDRYVGSIARRVGFTPILSCWTGLRAPISVSCFAAELKKLVFYFGKQETQTNFIFCGQTIVSFRELLIDWSTANSVDTKELEIPSWIMKVIAGGLSSPSPIRSDVLAWAVHGSWNLVPSGDIIKVAWPESD